MSEEQDLREARDMLSGAAFRRLKDGKRGAGKIKDGPEPDEFAFAMIASDGVTVNKFHVRLTRRVA